MIPLELDVLEPLGRVVARPWADAVTGMQVDSRRIEEGDPFVAITGSTGKTSTKDILFALCVPHRRTVANEGNHNTEIGVPLTVCRVEDDTEVCICELAMRGAGQIEWLASFVRPEIAVITNIGPAHLEFLGSLENIAKAKAELI